MPTPTVDNRPVVRYPEVPSGTQRLIEDLTALAFRMAKRLTIQEAIDAENGATIEVSHSSIKPAKRRATTTQRMAR